MENTHDEEKLTQVTTDQEAIQKAILTQLSVYESKHGEKYG